MGAYRGFVTTESAFIAALRTLATDPAARGLLDDAAVLEIGGAKLVLTHDMIVEGVHFLATDPPGDIAWKLVAVNLSDLAAKGAKPLGVLLGYTLADDDAWNEAFIAGLRQTLSAFRVALFGGDTVAASPGTARALGLTAIGLAEASPSRAGAAPGDHLWVSGTIGDGGAGLRIARRELDGPAALVERYRQPRPRLELGQALAPFVHAMMDVSDGLLIDAGRMADASGLALEIDLAVLPLSASFISMLGEDREARLEAATMGDDYELLFAAPEAQAVELLVLAERLGIPLTRIGEFAQGAGLGLRDGAETVPLPARLGYEHVPK